MMDVDELENARKMRAALLAILKSHCYFTCTTCKQTNPGVYDLCSEGEAIARRKMYWSSLVSRLEQGTRVPVPTAFYAAFTDEEVQS
jgi:hypothetical protein